MTNKILHMSDSHLGYNQYQSDIRREDFYNSFDDVISFAINEDFDAIVHTGDLFDSPNPNTTTINNVFETLCRLNEHDIPFLGIVGNHERKWLDQWMDIFEKIDCVYKLTNEPYILNGDNKKEDVCLYGFDSFRKTEWKCENMFLENFDEDRINILCLHELFDEIVPPYKADRSLETVVDCLDNKPDLIAMGDYHSPKETMVQSIPAFYAGATERTKSGATEPSVRVIEIEDGEITNTIKFVNEISGSSPRPFYTVAIETINQTTKDDVERRVKEDVPSELINQAVVVVKLTGEKTESIQPSSAYDVLESLDVSVPHVIDARNLINTDGEISDVTDPSKISIDVRITEDLPDMDKKMVEIEQSVRDLTIPKAQIRGEVDRIIEGENE